MNKVKVAIVYLPQTGPTSKVYENDKGIIYHCKSKQKDMQNVGMGFYSIQEPSKDDCLLAIEPYCVLDRDYSPTYASKYKYIFTWTPKAYSNNVFENKIVEINHPSCHDKPSTETLENRWLPWNERKNEIVFIANNKSSSHDSELYNLRIQLADLLHQHSKYKVSWYGQFKLNKPYYMGEAESKHEILRQVKFSVCTENSYDPIYSHNYFTEKMPEVWFSGAVPIYMGCYNIDDFGFAPHSYIDLRTYCSNKQNGLFTIDKDALIGRIEGFDQQRYENYKSDLHYNIKKENGLYHIISFERMYNTIIDTLFKT